ncbi:MAG TPA: glycosyltransferase family 39 protein, partial [Rhizomicrobium sp.]|nr:glycosyltransferase family 39 protein [Rhizomicrobium sp.]
MTDSETPVIAQETTPAGPAVPAWLTRLARRPFAVLGLLGLLLWLPGVLSLPALDRDESRFAQSSRQMVESGDVVDIRFGHVPRYKKPVGIYWLQAASTRIAMLFPQVHDDRIWTYRLPSLVGGIAASWLTLWCALAVAGAEAGLLAGILMLGTVLLTAEATIATTDAVLLACVLGVQGVLLRLYRAAHDPDFTPPRNRTVLWGWAAVGFGILVKFPIVPGVALATIIGLTTWDYWEQRRSRKPDTPPDAPGETPAWAWLGVLKSWRGVGLVLLLILPWLIAITIQSQGMFFEESLGNDFAAKMAGGQESHGGWPGYYLLLSAAAFWPTILFVLPGIAYAVSRRTEPAIRFLLAWAAGWWLVVELVPTKLPHYVIHAYPALAILAALFVLNPQPVRFLAPARWIAILQFVLGAGLLAAVIILAPRYFGGDAGWPVLTAAGTGAVLAIAALVLAIRHKPLPAVLLGFVSLLVFAPALTAYVGPRLDQLWITERLKPMVKAASRPGDAPPAIAGYQEPSLVFALGKDVVLADGKGAAEASARSGSLALVEDEALGDFLARLAELQADARPVGEVSGINYSRGRKMHVTLYRVAQLR